jgi:hypothetical protein
MSLGQSLRNFILGRRLANQEHVERKISAFEGVPAMGLDQLKVSPFPESNSYRAVAVVL